MNEIELREVSFRYPGAEELALKNLSVTIRKKDFTAIVGNNGCGKSTLCKVMNGLIPYYLQGDYSGETLVSGENTATLEIGEIAHRIGYVYQDFENQIVRPTVLDDASYSCFNYGHEDYLERGLEALVQCGLEEKTLEYVFQLSGGQTHLLALAGTLALGPDVLILDEPIAQLDPANSDRIYRILQWLNEERDKTILVIEHHTDYIAEYCKEVILMEAGQIRWKKETKEALRLVEDLFQNQIYPPQITQAAHELQKIHRIPASVELPVHLGETEAFFTKYGTLLANRIEKEEESPKQETAIAFSDIHLSYDSIRGEPNVVFDGLNLSLMRGEKIALIGSNGAGKSTLMKMLVNLLKPGRGSITLMDRNLRETNAETIARHISLVYQNPEEMFIMDTIEEDISFAMRERKVEGWEEKTADLLERFELTALKDRDGRLLSGGQMRRASLAIGVALRPSVLLLDEPTANLDIATRMNILKMLNELKETTETVVIATHDMQLVSEWADRIIVLYKGNVIADGNRDAIFDDARLAEKVGIRPPAIFAAAKELNEEARIYTVKDFVEAFKGEAHGTGD